MTSSGLSPQGTPAGTATASQGLSGPTKLAKRGWRRWYTGLLVALAVGSCLYLFREPVLQGVGGYLVVDEPAAADYAVLVGRSDGCYDRAAQLYHSGSVSGILVVEPRPDRLQRLGFLPLFTTLSQRELTAHGVPASAVTVVPGETRTDWDRARRLRAWLQGHPSDGLVILCERFDTRRFRFILDTILGADYAARVHLLALPHEPYDERNWWKNRLGFAHVFDCYVSLAYVRLWGEDRMQWRDWDPEYYQKRLR